MPQERRIYSKSFNVQVIAYCAQPDISIANVALTHNRMRPRITSCVIKPTTIYATAAPQISSRNLNHPFRWQAREDILPIGRRVPV